MDGEDKFIEQNKAREAMAELSEIHSEEVSKLRHKVEELEAEIKRANRTIAELRASPSKQPREQA